MRDAQPLQQPPITRLLARAFERLFAHHAERGHVDEALLLFIGQAGGGLPDLNVAGVPASAQALSS